MKQLLPVCLLIMTAFTGFLSPPAEQAPGRAAAGFYIRFRHMAGNAGLQLGETYRNAWGEPFTVRQLRYYIHRLSYTDDKGHYYTAPEAYYLVDEADSSSKIIGLPAPAGALVSIRFVVGVDSIDNSSGAQAGALDPVKGMFWTWNSGYIFAKLEGKSDSSHAPGHYMSYHVGGFKTPKNALREIRLSAAPGVSLLSMPVIEADVLAWFHGAHRIAISQSPVCHEPGAMALQLADNYSTMFSLAPAP
jgi:hypothetical protein